MSDLTDILKQDFIDIIMNSDDLAISATYHDYDAGTTETITLVMDEQIGAQDSQYRGAFWMDGTQRTPVRGHGVTLGGALWQITNLKYNRPNDSWRLTLMIHTTRT